MQNKSFISKFASALLALTFSGMAYCQQFNPMAGSDVVYSVPKYVEPSWLEQESELCKKDQWLLVPDDLRRSKLIADMADVYNALMLFHSVYSDYQLSLRSGTKTLGMEEMLIKGIADTTTFQWASSFKKAMVEVLNGADDLRDSVMNEYIVSLLGTYSLESLFHNDSIYDEDVYDEVLNEDNMRNDPFGRRCVDAIALAHDTVNGSPNEAALPLLVDVLTAGQYSPLLFDAWKTWRAMMAIEMGHSKDSYIPNEEYNRLRAIACYTILCHCYDYPGDWVAVNTFLLLCGEQNVNIYGPYDFGNQSIVVFYEMFPELLPDEE